jgi:hypothetical protein
MNRPKSGPAKPYSPAELAHFAEYREQRQLSAPRQCDRAAQCWVAKGPPAIDGTGYCVGCGGLPRALWP